jgi:hypothetical protein
MGHNSYEWIQNFNMFIIMVLHYVLAVAVVVIVVAVVVVVVAVVVTSTEKFHCMYFVVAKTYYI